MADLSFNDLVDKFIEKIAKSVPVKDFCNGNFDGKAITIYAGFEAEYLPNKEEYPLVAFGSVEQTQRGVNKDQVFTLAVGVAIEKDSKVTSDPDVDTGAVITRYAGIFLMEELTTLIQKEILSIKGLTCKVNIVGQSAIENLYPLFRGEFEISMEFPRNFRS